MRSRLVRAIRRAVPLYALLLVLPLALAPGRAAAQCTDPKDPA